MNARAQRSGQNDSNASSRSGPLDDALRAARPAVAALFGFSIFVNLLKLTIPLFVLQVLDRVLSSGNYDTLFYLSLLAIIALATGGALGAITKVLHNRVGSWIESTLIEPVVTASLDGKLTDRSMGSQPVRDLKEVRGFYGNQALSGLFDLPWAPIFLIVIFLMHPVLGAIATGFAVVLLLLAILGDATTRRAQERAAAESGQFMQGLAKGFQNSETLHAMGILPNFIRNAIAKSDAGSKSQDVVNDRTSLIMQTSRALRQVAQVLMLGAGAYFVIAGEATSGLMIAGSILLNLALAPVDQASATWRGYVNFREARTRLRRQLSVSDVEGQRGRTAMSKPRGVLTVTQAMYFPPGRKRPVIKPLNFSVAPGEMVGIIGAAAAGKTVLARMIVGLIAPQGGSLQLDDTNISDWVTGGVGRYVGYLPQDPDFFAGTVADNIGRLDPDGAERALAIREAAELVQAQGMILNLPQGYETDIETATVLLSRSERQKLALARAFYGEPQLIVLDEPASFLDRVGEAALVEALTAAKSRGATIVIVSQRPTLMRLCDRLILLRDGAMEAYGEPSKVLEKLKGGDDNDASRRVLRLAN